VWAQVSLDLDRLAAFVAPGLVRHRERLPDLTVTTDDVACMRVTRCTLCHAVLDAFQFRVWSNDHAIVAVLLCPTCQRRGKATEEQVHAMMSARYDLGRWNAS
jgi:hypothetical protein